jgi:hypothetical protein
VRLQEVAVAAPSAILVGEGIFMLVWLPGVSVIYAIASVVVGSALFIVLARALLRTLARIVVAFALAALGTVAFVWIYSLLPLVLNKVVP